MAGVAPRKTSAPSLSAGDWLAVGNRLLAEEGIAALKIDRLCERAGVTRGSFYWHFETISSFRAALVESWTTALDAEQAFLTRIGELEPRDRLATMLDWLMSEDKWTLERAMREWARGDESLQQAVARADRRVWRAVTQAFVDNGFDAEESSLRADLTFAAGVGSMHLAGASRMWAPGRRDALLNLLLKR